MLVLYYHIKFCVAIFINKKDSTPHNFTCVQPFYSCQRDLNPWPPPYQGDALPPEPWQLVIRPKNNITIQNNLQHYFPMQKVLNSTCHYSSLFILNPLSNNLICKNSRCHRCIKRINITKHRYRCYKITFFFNKTTYTFTFISYYKPYRSS